MRRLGAVPPRRATVTSSRLSVTCGTGIITGLAVYAPAWTDETQPRTDRPAVFYLYKRGEPCPHVVRPPAGFRRIATR